MPDLVRMPEVAAGATAAVLSQWPLPVGTDFAATDVIAVIETDKAVVDLTPEGPGRILRTLVDEGSEVEIGSPIALVAAPGEVVDDVDAALAALGVGAGSGAAPAEPPAPPAPAPTAPPAAAASTPAPAPPPASGAPVEAPAEDRGGRVFASPVARLVARQAGLSLDGIRGTGPNGRIRRRDVEAALAARGGAVPASTTPPPGPRPAAPAAAPARADVLADSAPTSLPHSRIRRAIAARLTQSKNEVPHFYLRGSARVDRLLALREEINAGEELRVSVTDLLVKAVARAHLTVPAANVVWTDDALLAYPTVDVAVAVATDDGLVTPVLRGVERLSVSQVAAATKDLAARARTGQLRQHELEGGTTCVTNLGMYGTEDFAAIINPPQSSILAVGAARAEPVVVDGELSVATVLRVTLSVDHRPIDGAVAAEWLRVFLALLENPAKILS
ncbi:MAG: 2-oxo acid dehydrogenase subunit E2 [Candidatus Nanopelagicales bacterium]